MATPDPAPGTVRILIDFNGQTGEFAVSGPMEQPTMFLGMLETAKMIMLEQRAKAERIAAAPKILSLAPDLDLSNLHRH